MSERYGPCPRCKGTAKIHLKGDPEPKECGACDGTGFSGDAMLYYAKEVERSDANVPFEFKYGRPYGDFK